MLDRQTRFASVSTSNDNGTSAVRSLSQMLSERAADHANRRRVERKFTRLTANAICAEESGGRLRLQCLSQDLRKRNRSGSRARAIVNGRSADYREKEDVRQYAERK